MWYQCKKPDLHGLYWCLECWGQLTQRFEDEGNGFQHVIQKLVHTNYFTYLCPLEPSVAFQFSFNSSASLRSSPTSLSLPSHLHPSKSSTWLLAQCWRLGRCFEPQDERADRVMRILMSRASGFWHTHTKLTVYSVQSSAACLMWAILKFWFCMKVELKWCEKVQM